MQRVTYLIDIEAPCDEVFDTVTNIERRMQLSPLWGLNQLVEVEPNFPEPGSSYRVQVRTDKPFELPQSISDTSNTKENALEGLSQALFLMWGSTETGEDKQSETGSPAETVEEAEQVPVETAPIEHTYVVDEYEPQKKFSYYLDEDCETVVTWNFQSIPLGTRIRYEEVFCDENIRDEDFVSIVKNVVREWMANIKRYSELRESGGRRLVKWFLDRFYLKLRPEARRAVLISLYLQAIGLGTFVVAAVTWGIIMLLV